MIDPRALQQHFKKVHQQQVPKKPTVPRILNSKPLTAIEAIFVPEPIVEQKKEIISTPKTEPINLIIEAPPPIGDLIIEEIEIEEPIESTLIEEDLLKEAPKKELIQGIKAENPYGYSAPKEREEDYDPYGYYSGPRF